MRRFKIPLSCLCSLLLVVVSQSSSISAQSAVRIEPARGGLGWLTRPYQQRYVPPINLTNSSRLEALVRAGNLYLSAQDVIALALENNLDIEIQRYGPLLAKEVRRRTEGGQLLRDVTVPIAAGPASVSLTGVSLNAGGGAGTTVGVASSSVLTSVGPAIPNLDPQVSLFANFSHSTTVQTNTFVTGTTALVQSSRSFQAQISKSNQWGTLAQLTYSSSHFKYNSRAFDLNPFSQGDVDLQISQNLLNGFGSSVLGRNIIVAKNQEKVSDLQFKQQVITTVSAVLNLYWDLVSFNEDLKAKRDELATAQQLFEDNKKQVQIGTLAPIEVTRAESQVYTAQQDLLVAQTNLLQQETVLKNALSRNGVASPTIALVHVIPLDKVSVPEKEDIPPIEQLVPEALRKRVEIAENDLNIASSKAQLRGIKNGLKPTLQVFAELTNNGLSGAPNYLGDGTVTLPYLTGGYGNLLGQIFRRNYPSYAAGLSLNIPLRNRAAQSDYVTQALSLRQSELGLQKAVNQIRVDVQNAVIGLRQARVRYDSSVKARILQRQTLDADQKKYTLGASTVFQVVTDQQALAAAQSAEQQALANYSHARVAFDQNMGRTLEVNDISISEALAGTVARQSVLPANLPAPADQSGLPQPRQQ